MKTSAKHIGLAVRP